MNDTIKFGTAAPHIHDWRTSANAAWICSATLLPIIAASVLHYGLAAGNIWLASVLAAVIAETLATVFRKKLSLSDGSAVLTGLLVASAMPPGVSLYIPVSASIFAIVAVKIAFGGLGSNWMNPALGGIAFAYANWPVAMRNFMQPLVLKGLDGVSTVTPLELARSLNTISVPKVMDAFRAAEYPLSAIDSSVTGFLNDSIFSMLGARLPEGYIDLILGLRPGTLGESAIFAVFIGSIILLATGLIKLEIPLGMVTAFSMLSRIFGTGLPSETFFSGDVLFALCSGGFLLAAFYMATDPVSSPVDSRFSLFYGICIGILSFVFRRWGAQSEGVVYAILLMNILVPTVERKVRSRGLAAGKEAGQ